MEEDYIENYKKSSSSTHDYVISYFQSKNKFAAVLYITLLKGDIAMVKKVIDSGNYKFGEETSVAGTPILFTQTDHELLHILIETKHYEIIKYLISKRCFTLTELLFHDPDFTGSYSCSDDCLLPEMLKNKAVSADDLQSICCKAFEMERYDVILYLIRNPDVEILQFECATPKLTIFLSKIGELIDGEGESIKILNLMKKKRVLSESEFSQMMFCSFIRDLEKENPIETKYQQLYDEYQVQKILPHVSNFIVCRKSEDGYTLRWIFKTLQKFYGQNTTASLKKLNLPNNEYIKLLHEFDNLQEQIIKYLVETDKIKGVFCEAFLNMDFEVLLNLLKALKELPECGKSKIMTIILLANSFFEMYGENLDFNLFRKFFGSNQEFEEAMAVVKLCSQQSHFDDDHFDLLKKINFQVNKLPCRMQNIFGLFQTLAVKLDNQIALDKLEPSTEEIAKMLDTAINGSINNGSKYIMFFLRIVLERNLPIISRQRLLDYLTSNIKKEKLLQNEPVLAARVLLMVMTEAKRDLLIYKILQFGIDFTVRNSKGLQIQDYLIYSSPEIKNMILQKMKNEKVIRPPSINTQLADLFLRNYHNPPEAWKFFKRGLPPFIGLELEVAFNNPQHLVEAAAELATLAEEEPDSFFISKDSSIKPMGFEIVTNVFGVKELKTLIEPIVNIVQRSNGFCHSSCGLHIAIDKSPEMQEKVQKLVENKDFQEPMELMGKRKMNGYCQWKYDPSEKYTAFNMRQSDKTIELRFFRCTLVSQNISRSIDFVKDIVELTYEKLVAKYIPSSPFTLKDVAKRVIRSAKKKPKKSEGGKYRGRSSRLKKLKSSKRRSRKKSSRRHKRK